MLPLPIPPLLKQAPPIPIEEVDPKDPLAIGLYYHEKNCLDVAAYYFSISAASGNPIGLVLYAITQRHGWGVQKNETLAVKLLQEATQSAIQDLETLNSEFKKGNLSKFPRDKIDEDKKTLIASELVLAIYELAVCFKQGWGVSKSAETAAYYLLLAAQLGDKDAQLEIAECYLRGDGVRRDKKMAAKWFRTAEKNGARMVAMHWIWKPKYD
jgi:TPR repeat protein